MNNVDLFPIIFISGVLAIMLSYFIAHSYDIRTLIGKVTSPFFVPLRKFVVWGDKKFGTCDMRLTLEPRRRDENE